MPGRTKARGDTPEEVEEQEAPTSAQPLVEDESGDPMDEDQPEGEEEAEPEEEPQRVRIVRLIENQYPGESICFRFTC